MRTRELLLNGLMFMVVLLAPPFQPARAALVTTEQAVSASQVQAARDNVRAFVNRADAEKSFKALGLAPELAKQRVDALTDEEVVKISGKIDKLPAGGELGKYDIIIILLVALLVVVVI